MPLKPSRAKSSTKTSISINIAQQELTLWQSGTPLLRCPISSGKAGCGSQEGSGKTPLGRFIIASKHGENAPRNSIFVGRIPKTIWKGETGHDHILHRILTLDGQEAHNANTRARYIYLHGTSDEALLGTPASMGCIRIGYEPLLQIFAHCSIETKVSIS